MPIIKNIRGNMRVVSVDGALLGTVESVEGNRVKIAGGGATGQFLPGHLIAGVEGNEVRLSANSTEAADLFERD
jgi:hypothetical protein